MIIDMYLTKEPDYGINLWSKEPLWNPVLKQWEPASGDSPLEDIIQQRLLLSEDSSEKPVKVRITIERI